MLTGKSLSFTAVKQYFYILIDETKYTLEQYVNKIKEENKEILFTHEMLSNIKYLYRGKVLEYSELENQETCDLPTPYFYDNDNIRSKELLGVFVLQDGYIIRLLETLDRYIRKARYETIKAANILDVNFLNHDVNAHFYEFYYLLRCFNAENAVFSYYSVYEILLQIVWIYNEFYDSTKPFKEILKKCKPFKLSDKLRKKDDIRFLPLLFDYSPSEEKYIVKAKFKKIRDWCNSFKHHGILRFEGEKIQDKPTFTRTYADEYKAQNEVKDFGSIDFEASYIDLDNEVIPALIKYYNDSIELADKILLEIGYK